MEEGTKFRLVRCPKCENLLPEPPNLPVYRCGGCDAVLQAKNQPTSSGGSPEKSDDERVRVSSGKLESFPEKGEGEELIESNGVKKRERGLLNGIAEPNSSSSPRIDNKVVNEKLNQQSLEEESPPSGSKYRRPAKDPVDNWVLGNDHDMNRNREKSVGVNMEKGGNDLQKGFASRSRRAGGPIPNWRSLDRDGSIVYRRTPRAVEEDVRFSGSPYLDAGPSNYQASSNSYGLVEKSSDGPDRVEHLEQDRAELLRKLEELNLLKDQLTRSRDMADKPKEGMPFDGRAVPVDPYVDRDAWFPEGSSRQHRASMQPFPAEKHAQRPLYSNCGLESIPTMNRHGMDMQNFYPPLMHASNDIPGYGDPYAAQMVGPNKPPHQYQRHPSRDYFSTQYMGMDSDHNASYPTNTFFHQPACSCLHCYNKQWHAPAQIPPSVLHNRRFPDEASNPMLYHVENRGTFVPRNYNSRDPNPPPMRHVVHPQFGRQNLDTGTGGFGQNHPRRVLPVKRSGRRCCPIAGGAPFITCHNCFELLPLPKKVLLMEKNYRKLRCGACSTIISLLIENDKIVASVPVQIDGVSLAVNDSPGGGVKEDVLQSHSRANDHGGADSSDYDSSGYHFHLTDTEPGSSSMDRKQNISEAEKLEDLVSSCSITSEDDESPDSVIARREVSNSAEPHLKDRGTPPLPASPLREPSNQVVSKFEKGNRSKRINQEEVILTKGTSRQNSVKDTSVATEMDVSFNEYSNGAMSQEYGDVSKEERQRVNKGGDSYFVGLIKKGFKDLSKSHNTGENDRSNVMINGHPISERSLKKAEKKSGPVHPGQYWYDVRAGFWGVMGQPCLGILPPYIEEFNYPLPENCAGGNTGVYVNGRELHQKDLDLLANRGLPTVTDRSYIIEISGKVTDEDTGEELDNLGKLAPTVEKLKHGFGMRVPRVAV